MEKPPSPKRKLDVFAQDDLSILPSFAPVKLSDRSIRICKSDDDCLLCADVEEANGTGFISLEACEPPKRGEDRDEDPNAELRDEEEQYLVDKLLSGDDEVVVESVKRSLYGGEISINCRYRSEENVFVTMAQLENPTPITRWARDTDSKPRLATRSSEDMPIRSDWVDDKRVASEEAIPVSVLDNVGLQDYGFGFTMPIPESLCGPLPFNDELLAHTLLYDTLPRRIQYAAKAMSKSTRETQTSYFWYRRNISSAEQDRYGFKQAYTRDLGMLTGFCMHFIFYKYGQDGRGEPLYFAEQLMPPDKDVMFEAKKSGALAAAKDALVRLGKRQWEKGGENILDPDEEHRRLCALVAPLVTLKYTTPVVTLDGLKSVAMNARYNCAYCRLLCIQIYCPCCHATTKVMPSSNPEATPYYLVTCKQCGR
jgi:hypothetical protein